MDKKGNNFGIKEMAKSERPRERMLLFGAEGLSNSELMAILISSGSKDESALNIAGKLLSKENGDLHAFMNYKTQEYCKVKGIGTATACRLSAAAELGRRIYSSPKDRLHLDNPGVLAEYLSDMRYYQKEVMRVAMFNSKMELIKTADISTGALAETSASAREVFSDAIRIGAYAIVLIHNHPSGDPTPSRNDISTTEKLIEAGKILGIEVMDHIIIGDGRYISFKEQKML